MRLLPDGTIECPPDELPAVLAALAAPGARAARAALATDAKPERPVDESMSRSHPSPGPRPGHGPGPAPAQSATAEPQTRSEVAEAVEAVLARARLKGGLWAGLRALQACGTMTMPEMIEATGATGPKAAFSVSGIMSGLDKAAQRFGLSREDFAPSERNAEGVMVYIAGRLLKEAPPLE